MSIYGKYRNIIFIKPIMKKRNLFIKGVALGLLALASPSAMAQTPEPAEVIEYLLVTEKGGAQTAFKFGENPVITFTQQAEPEGDAVLLLNVEAGEQLLSVPVADVQDYKLVKEADLPPSVSIEKDVTVADNGGKPEFANGKACFSGLKPGAQVSVYTLDGVKVMSVAADASGAATVDLGSLDKGTVYILRTPTAGYKLMNK